VLFVDDLYPGLIESLLDVPHVVECKYWTLIEPLEPTQKLAMDGPPQVGCMAKLVMLWFCVIDI
jgi:hypothetical protein